jgi:hypothetical protein
MGETEDKSFFCRASGAIGRNQAKQSFGGVLQGVFLVKITNFSGEMPDAADAR